MGSDLGRARPACPGLFAVPAQSKKGGRVDRGRRYRAPGTELAGGNDLPANPRGRVEGDQRKEHHLGSEELRQPGDGFRSAVHASGVRLSLGGRQGPVSVSLPHLPFLDRRQGGGRPRATAAGPVPNQAERQQTDARQTTGTGGEKVVRRSIRWMNAWVDNRTGIHSAVRQFLYEEIPASSGWHQIFGSVAMFLFLVQAFTGALLAFNYAPTPGDAYNSLRYILTELTGGRLMRGLH